MTDNNEKITGTEDNMQKVYDRMATHPKAWEGFLATAEINPAPFEVFFKSLPKGSEILDIGPGKGIEARMAVDAGHKVTGLDFSPEMLQKFQNHVPEAKGILADMTEIPSDIGPFNAVLSSCSLLHVNQEKGIKALEGFHRVLKKDGILFLTTTVHDGKEELNERSWLKDAGIDSWFFYHWQEEALLKTIQDVGFTVTNHDKSILIEDRPALVYITAKKE